MILALDLGMRCGWAFRHRNGKTIFSGMCDLAPASQRRFEGGGMRYVRMHELLEDMYQREPVHQVFYEEVRAHKGTSAAHVYGGMQAILTAWCEHRDTPYAAIPVAQIKKFATGHGNASKEEMCAAFEAIVGRPPESPDEADAYWLLASQDGR